MREVDLVVVGTGPGGESLANQAAAAGLEVVAVDKHLVGGECPYYGCIPSKIMLRAADSLAETRRAAEVAGDVSVVPSWSPVAKRVAEATADWDDEAAVRRLVSAGVTVHHGTARLTGPREVTIVPAPEAEPIAYTARRGVVLNPGTRPMVPEVPGLADLPYWTNRDAVRTDSVPRELVVVGGGPIGCELAQAFARFGSRVTIVQRAERLLPGDEPEASAFLEQVLVDEGVRVLTKVELAGADHADGTFRIELSDGEHLTADRLLLAAGRRPNLDDIGLETVGIDPAKVEVDEFMRAGDGLWVIGDVAGHGAYTHMSMYQSAVALRDILDQPGPAASYHAVPHTTFTDPEVAGVGLTEAQARATRNDVRVGRADLAESSRGFTYGPGGAGLVKIVEGHGVLIGATVVGPLGGEILSMLTLAVHARIPVTTLRSMIYAYPTFHRAVETALADLG